MQKMAGGANVVQSFKIYFSLPASKRSSRPGGEKENKTRIGKKNLQLNPYQAKIQKIVQSAIFKGEMVMQDTNMKLNEIKKKLYRLPDHKLEEVDDFLGFLLSKEKGETGKVVQMKGVWAGKGFEKLNLRKEIKKGRQELSKSILKRGL